MILLDRRLWSHFDFISPCLILPIIILSYVLISDFNDFLGNKMLVYFAFGAAVFLLFFILPLRRLEWLIPLVFWVSIALLLGVELFGVSKLGAKRWLEIPFVHFTIQPSEIMKPAFILMLAHLIKKNPPGQNGYGIKKFIKFSFYILIPFGLILKEPDLGTALILLISGYGVLFLVGVDKRIWIALVLATAIFTPLLYDGLKDYQKKRIRDFISEEPAYQVRQSIIAIGNGGLWGKSEDEATQSKFKFLPISTSDFIFAYTIERHGFVGGALLLGLYGFLISHFLSLISRFKGDFFAKSVAAGIAMLLFIYVSVNVLMTMGFAPVVGVPLPFYSYGGSSFITFMSLFGIMQNLAAFRFDPEYNKLLKIKL